MTSLVPGLLVLHGNRLELLRDAVFEWIAAHPLDPLEEEVFLVQSNAAAEWIKIALAERTGICAATRVSLPARFVWNAYRRVLGTDRIAERSALDRDALVWRLMRLLPGRLHQSIFAPIAAYLADGDVMRRLQLAEKLADLYDGYQVYRPDWLVAWEAQRNVLIAADGRERSLPPDDLWQAALWRDLVRELDQRDRAMTRPAVHRAFVDALPAGKAERPHGLPRRVVLFGASHLSASSMEALAHLSTFVQVLVAVPNPSRYYWSDTIDGRELLRSARRRHPLRDPRVDPATVALEDLHAHTHPLLAAWGRQGRDFMRLLDAFDDAEAARARFAIDRVDYFDDAPGTTLLEQVQAAVRDLLPLKDHPHATIAASDRSIVFNVAHGPQREVEILHDQLLALFDERSHGNRPLQPRDVIVMVPDIEVFAPAIRAVFGQYRDDDPRHIPHAIADLKSRGSDPLIVAIEWMLDVAVHRVRVGEVRDLFDVPAIAARFGLAADDVRSLFAWVEDANARWGLDGAHRASLGFAACGAQNTWDFGLQRLLLGHAAGPGSSFDGIDALDRVGGLETASIGALAEFIARLERWRETSMGAASPGAWAVRFRALLDDMVAATDERERITVAALTDALADWLAACDAAGFDEAVPITIAREGWLGRLAGLASNRRFLSGGVTFCTLQPLRALPFDTVCLLGLADGDYPRPVRSSDFDLMSSPRMQRPGDRSRRDDDRYLMLEALLSARSTLYISWSGRSARDNSERPSSVLVAQLRDYLDAGWTSASSASVVDDRTTMHPLQPFARRYFEEDGPVTFAHEWRRRTESGADAKRASTARNAASNDVEIRPALTFDRLRSFLANPVRAYFTDQLDVSVRGKDERVLDDETFALDGLERWRLIDEVVHAAAQERGPDLEAVVDACIDRVAASGRLPMLGGGLRDRDELRATAIPMLEHWRAFVAAMPREAPRRRVRIERVGLVVDDWIDHLRLDADGELAWIGLDASRLVEGRKGKGSKAETIRPTKLLAAWVRMLVASASGIALRAYVIGCDGAIKVDAPDPGHAVAALDVLLDAWRASRDADDPLPVTAKTAFARLGKGNPKNVYEGGGQGQQSRGEVDDDFALARAYPDFSALERQGFDDWVDRLYGPIQSWVGSHASITMHDAATTSSA